MFDHSHILIRYAVFVLAKYDDLLYDLQLLLLKE